MERHRPLQPGDPGALGTDRTDSPCAVATDFSSFVPSHQAILARVARPRGGIYQRAVAAYSDPAVPQPAGWTFGLSDLSPNAQSTHSALLPRELTHIRRMGIGVATARPGSAGALELTFSTEAAPWRGDLGAFLRDRLPLGGLHPSGCGSWDQGLIASLR